MSEQDDDKIISDALNLMRQVREENTSLRTECESYKASIATYEVELDRKTSEAIFLRRALTVANNHAALLARIVEKVDASLSQAAALIKRGRESQERDPYTGGRVETLDGRPSRAS